MIELIEAACGRKAERNLLPMQPGDVRDTYADITAIERDLSFKPTTSIDEGVPKFVVWYRGIMRCRHVKAGLGEQIGLDFVLCLF